MYARYYQLRNTETQTLGYSYKVRKLIINNINRINFALLIFPFTKHRYTVLCHEPG